MEAFTYATIPDDVTAWLKTAPVEARARAVTLGVRMYSSGVMDSVVPVTAAAPDQIAVTKGQIGEAYVQEILSQRFVVRNNTKTARSGDLTLYIDDAKLLVEVKNYKNPVPGAEVEKFLRDLASGLQYGGVFISLASAIGGGLDGLRFEQVGDSYLPVVYVNSAEPQVITMAVQSVYMMITAQKYVLREVYNKDALAAEIRELTEQLDVLSRGNSSYHDVIDQVSSLLRKNAQSLLLAETGLKDRIRGIRGLLYDQKVLSRDEIIAMLEGFGAAPHVMDAARAVDSCGDATPGKSWRTYKFKIVHLPTDLTITFAKTGSTIIIPEKYVDDTTALKIRRQFPKRVTWDTNFTVDLTPETTPVVIEVFVKPHQRA